ncbi:ABC-2 family transporter protein [Lacticaseibacillus paracasei]|uniref:ABC transporter n=1 Tax=Lacticaseibacillus paracasei TaxID=1597 RepID=UPI000FECFBCA|nr:ABC transporter [Lacticaseibacillus paracasei]RND69375.1 ABC-2 family transporter protein [Lacticaseibacillus paracasei]
MLFHYLKFEFTKRNRRWWIWLFIAVLTGVGILGNFQQQAAQNEFVQKYRQALIQQGADQADGPATLKTEFKKLNGPQAAYNQWFAAELPIISGKEPATKENEGANYRIAILNGTAKPDYLDAINRTYQQNEILAQHKITAYYPQGLLFTDQELQAMPDETEKLVREWFPTFYVRGFDYLQYLFQQNVPFYLLLIGIIVSGGFFAKELAHKRAHSNWLQLQGEALVKQMMVQFLTISLTLAEIVFLPLSLTTLVTGLLRGFGSWEFPVLNNTYQDAFNSFSETFTTRGQLLIRSAGLLLLLIALVAAFNIAVALISKNAWLTTSIVLIVVASALLIPPISWLPLSFFHVWGIANGTIAQSVDLPGLQLGQGALVIAIWSGILLLVEVISSFNFASWYPFRDSTKSSRVERV